MEEFSFEKYQVGNWDEVNKKSGGERDDLPFWEVLGRNKWWKKFENIFDGRKSCMHEIEILKYFEEKFSDDEIQKIKLVIATKKIIQMTIWPFF